MIDKAVLNTLADILHKKKLHELEYESEGVRIKMVGESAQTVAVTTPVIPQATAPVQEAPKAPVKKEIDDKDLIKSPLVGVIFLAPEPGAEPFVSVGKEVKKGDTLCLVEAMKTFNPLKAPRNGKITQILIEDGNAIEFDEPLFALE